ncbi:MAG TPA: ABC transporter ATP-binding protein [Candidatus Atribacteria bacterium]|nr:ABC transporter ATP-binding protein [Candidatus Atribacteria bacterium]
MKNINKRFPLVVANDKVNFTVYKGEIHALVGENGAGKSTLMSILYGLYQADSGQIFVNGEKVNIANPKVAINLKIGMVHQHFMLVQPLTVTENIILGMEPKKNNIFIDMENAIKKVEDLSKSMGFKIDPQAKIENISVGIQQRVEIIKVLYRGAEILVMDEPTAVLTPQEVEELFGILRSLKKQGKTIIFITHKLNEVIELSDRVTVMRKGKVVGVKKTKDTNQEEIASMMVGREVIFEIEKKPINMGKIALKVDKLKALNRKGLPAVKDISFEIKEGEILGFAGVEGNGQTELVEVITGLRSASSGKIFLYDKEITKDSPRDIREDKIAHIPEDRRQRGIISEYTVAENLILGSQYRPPFNQGLTLNFTAINKHANNLIKNFDIRPSDKDNLLKSLSGGNQQKVIVARELYGEPNLLIAAQPTRGLDVGSIEFVHQEILNERDKGKAILLISADLEEILSLSDRIAVIYEGEIVAFLDPKKTDEKEIGLLMTGSTKNKKLSKDK